MVCHTLVSGCKDATCFTREDILVIDRGSYLMGGRALDEGGAACFEVTACNGVCAGNAVRGGVQALTRISHETDN
jgi:hypothetical protein